MSDPDPLAELQGSADKVAEYVAGDFADRYRGHAASKVIRDPVLGFHKIDPEFLLLLDSPFLQRLRRLHQTSLAYHTYPSARHSRFEHSLGVFSIAEMMLEALDRNDRFRDEMDFKIDPISRLEVLAAALLHDISHGPFSHTSEDVYGQEEIFGRIGRSDEIFRRATATPSEIQAYVLLKSSAFGEIWSRFRDISNEDPNLDHVAKMIIGEYESLPARLQPLQGVINGPLDADKMDYIARDSHFTGLVTHLDVERLMQGMLVLPVPRDDGDAIQQLVVDSSSVGAMEQLIFARAQLYIQMYQHHKIRASGQLAQRLIRELRSADAVFGDFPLSDPTTFMAIDEPIILARSDNDEISTLAKRIHTRELPERSLVLGTASFPGENEGDVEGLIESTWGALRRDLKKGRRSITDEVAKIADHASLASHQVMIDLPASPKFMKDRHPLVRLWRDKLVPLHEVFPMLGWENAHEEYLSISYIFSDSKAEKEAVAKAAEKWLFDEGVVMTEAAFRMAKLPTAPSYFIDDIKDTV